MVVAPAQVTAARRVLLTGSRLARSALTQETARLALVGKVVTGGDAVSLLPQDVEPAAGLDVAAARRRLAGAVGGGWTTELLTVAGTEPAGAVAVVPSTVVGWQGDGAWGLQHGGSAAQVDTRSGAGGQRALAGRSAVPRAGGRRRMQQGGPAPIASQYGHLCSCTPCGGREHVRAGAVRRRLDHRARARHRRPRRPRRRRPAPRRVARADLPPSRAAHPARRLATARGARRRPRGGREDDPRAQCRGRRRCPVRRARGPRGRRPRAGRRVHARARRDR